MPPPSEPLTHTIHTGHLYLGKKGTSLLWVDTQARKAPRVTRRSAKPLVRRARADADIGEAIDYYLAESPAVALRFVDALEAAYRHIRRTPAPVRRVTRTS